MEIETGTFIMLAFLTAAMGAFAYVESANRKINQLTDRLARYENHITKKHE